MKKLSEKSFISNLQNRKMGRMLAKRFREDAQHRELLALEDYALKKREKGIKKIEGENYTLTIK